MKMQQQRIFARYIRLKRQALLLRRRSHISEAAELLHQVIKFGDVVVDVFIAVLRIESLASLAAS